MKLSATVALSGLVGGCLGRDDAQQPHEQHVRVSRVLGGRVCKGSVLKSTEKLYPNEYICENEDGKEYLFGLSSNGELHEIHFDADGTKDVYWTSGQKGNYVRIQRDGNIVLRNDGGDAVWSSGCYGAGADLTFHPQYKGIGARMYAPGSGPDGSIWSVASWAEDGLCHPPIKCMGGTLEPGQSLERDEYLCVDDEDDDWHRSFRFGVGNNGLFALFWKNEPIWTPDTKTAGSHELRMQQGGKLILRDNDDTVIWDSGCKSDGNTVKMTSRGVLMNNDDGDTSWYIGYDGEESTCSPSSIPRDLCKKVSTKDGSDTCRYRMIDHLNVNYVVLQVEQVGHNKYVVTDNVGGSCSGHKEEWDVDVEKRSTGALIMGAGVPEVTCYELMNDWQDGSPGWQMRDDTQLTFTPDTYGDDEEDYPCTDFAKNLIYFMIQEWYYFG